MERKRVLVVDDEPDICRVVKKSLERLGYNVAVETNGANAADRARDESPDLVIMDIHMPQANGLEMCGRMKSDKALGQTPVLIISASQEPTFSVAAMSVGASGYLTKPFDIEDLGHAVDVLVEKGYLFSEDGIFSA